MPNFNKSETLLIRLEKDLKENSRSVLSRHGLTQSKAIRRFLDFVIENRDNPELLKEILGNSKT